MKEVENLVVRQPKITLNRIDTKTKQISKPCSCKNNLIRV